MYKSSLKQVTNNQTPQQKQNKKELRLDLNKTTISNQLQNSDKLTFTFRQQSANRQGNNGNNNTTNKQQYRRGHSYSYNSQTTKFQKGSIIDKFQLLEKDTLSQFQVNQDIKLYKKPEVDILDHLSPHIKAINDQEDISKVKKKNKYQEKNIPYKYKLSYLNQDYNNKMKQLEVAFQDLTDTKAVKHQKKLNKSFTNYGNYQRFLEDDQDFMQKNLQQLENESDSETDYEEQQKQEEEQKKKKLLNHNKVPPIEYQPTYLANRKILNDKLNDQQTRLEVLDRSLLRNFYYDDQKKKEDEILKSMTKQYKKFDIQKFKQRKKEVYQKIETLPTNQTRLKQMEQGKVNNKLYTYGNELNRQQLKIINKTRKYRSIIMTQKFIANDLDTQKQKNIEKLEYLIHYESPNELMYKNDTQKRPQDIILRRCFHYASNKDDSNLNVKFQYVQRQKFQEFISLILNKQIQKEEIYEIYDKITINSEYNSMNFYDFTEGVRRMAIYYYFQSGLYKHSINNQDQIEYHAVLDKFIKEIIMPLENTFISQTEIDLNRFSKLTEVQDFLHTFNIALKQIFMFFAQMRNSKLIDHTSFYMNFPDIFEIVWKLGFFPTKITKLEIRQYYYYTLANHQGLDYEDFTRFMHLLGVHIVTKPQNQIQKKNEIYGNGGGNMESSQKSKGLNIQNEVQNIMKKLEDPDELSDDHDDMGNVIESKRQMNIFRKQSIKEYGQQLKKFIEKIVLFYMDPNYMDYMNIQSKLNKIASTNFSSNII